MKKAVVYTLALTFLLAMLSGCGADGMLSGDVRVTNDPNAETYPTVSASPAVVTPDVEDGIVRDEDGFITDNDTGARSTPKPETGRKTESAVSPSPSADPTSRP